MEDVTLTTERFTLESITPKKIHWLFDTKDDSQICEYLGIDEVNLPHYRNMHEGGMETNRYSHYYFLIRDKESAIPMGECGFHTWDRKHHRAELFYLLRLDEYKNKGYMTEIIKTVIGFGFKELKLHRMQALVANWNEPSLKLLKRFNFVFEGTSREDYLFEGKFEDSERFSLLASEWNGE